METKYHTFAQHNGFATEGGKTLSPVTLAYETYGEPERRQIERGPRAPRPDRRRPRGRPSRGRQGSRLVGQHDRPGQGLRYGQVLHHLLERARGMQGLHRSLVDQPGNRETLRPRFSPHYRRGYGKCPASPRGLPRNRAAPFGGRRLHGRHAGPPVGRLLSGKGPLGHTHRHDGHPLAPADRIQ